MSKPLLICEIPTDLLKLNIQLSKNKTRMRKLAIFSSNQTNVYRTHYLSNQHYLSLTFKSSWQCSYITIDSGNVL